MRITSVDVSPTTDFTLPTFDNTKLVAINTCPTWGIIRYTQHRTFVGVGRAMALEAGGAAHEVFAAHRLYSLREFGQQFYGFSEEVRDDIFNTTGKRLFGERRFEEMVAAVDEREDFRTRCNNFSLTALYNCGFYDDPGDKRRTMTNIEEMCIAYMDRRSWENELPVVRGNDPNSLFVGIEIPVDVTVTIEYVDQHGEASILKVRFIGKADGLHWADQTKKDMRVHENKTASRLGDAWELSWETNHQPTGYMIALSALLNFPIRQGLMLGSCLPMPKSYAINGLSRVVARRAPWQITEWFEWFLHTVLLHNQYADDVTHAPMYTHSCNRYFRPCSFVPLCAVPRDERLVMIEEMAVQEWSPLHAQGEPTDE